MLKVHVVLATLLLSLGTLRVAAEDNFLKRLTGDNSEKKSTNRLNELLIGEYLERTSALAAKLEKLADLAEKHQTAKETLLISDAGKRIAQRDDSVRAFINLDEDPVVTAADVATHQQRIEPLRQGFAVYADIPEVFNARRVSECQLLADEEDWAATALRELKHRESIITALVNLTPKTQDSGELPTLGSRITELTSSMIQEETQAVDLAREASRKEGIEEKAEAASTRELELAKQDAANELRLMRLELAHARAEFAVIEAQRRAAIQEIEQTAEKTNLATRLEDRAVLKKLRPFTADGFWQPGNASRASSLKRGPMSYAALEQFGALNSGHQGLARLLAVANGTGIGNHVESSGQYDIPRTYTGTYVSRKHIDTDRPKWSYPKDFQKLSAEQLLEVEEVQDLLVELGPTMVEKGLLAP